MKTDAIAPKEQVQAPKPAPKQEDVEAKEQAEKAAAEEASAKESLAVA